MLLGSLAAQTRDFPLYTSCFSLFRTRVPLQLVSSTDESRCGGYKLDKPTTPPSAAWGSPPLALCADKSRAPVRSASCGEPQPLRPTLRCDGPSDPSPDC